MYVGVAVGRRGLRGRVWGNHLDTGLDLSSFRRNVCEYIGVAPTSRTRVRPLVTAAVEVDLVGEWIRECEVAWIECVDAPVARLLECELKAEFRPLLTKR